jgi:hypothetical protein
MTRRVLTRSFIVLALGVAIVMTIAGVVVANGAHQPREVDDEPFSSRPATPAVQLLAGTSRTGTQWEAVSYETNGGYRCVDTAYTTDRGDRVASGGCFTPDFPNETQRSVSTLPDGTKIVAGMLEGATRGGRREVTVDFASGLSKTVLSNNDGVFVVDGDTSDPVRLTYRAHTGEMWQHGFSRGRP